jgi:hypothetical protein
VHFQLDTHLPDVVRAQGGDLLHDRVDVVEAAFARAAMDEPQQVPDDLAGPSGFGADGFEILARLIAE